MPQPRQPEIPSPLHSVCDYPSPDSELQPVPLTKGGRLGL